VVYTPRGVTNMLLACSVTSSTQTLSKANPVFSFQLNTHHMLTLILLTWRIWWAPNNVIKWQMGFNSAFKGLNACIYQPLPSTCLGVCYTIFRQTITSLATILYAFCNVDWNVQYTLFFFNLQCCYNVYIVHFRATAQKKHIVFEQETQWSPWRWWNKHRNM